MQTRFILIETSHAGNVGAAARALKVMGFDDLVLVRPRWPDVLQREEAVDRASGAADVLARARVVDTLDEALDGMTHLCATAMTPRDFGPPTRAPREHFSRLLADAAVPDAVQPEGVAFLFGSERFGMKNEDVYRSHACLSIPTNPSFGSLNLAAAVQLIAYEWRQALGGFAVHEGVAPRPAADAAATTSASIDIHDTGWRAFTTGGATTGATPPTAAADASLIGLGGMSGVSGFMRDSSSILGPATRLARRAGFRSHGQTRRPSHRQRCGDGWRWRMPATNRCQAQPLRGGSAPPNC